MSLITQSNYSAAGTEFVYADSDTDNYDREHTSKVAKALSEHTHADTRGLAVGRLASNAVLTASITDLNVTTGKLADLAVTTGKIAAAAVTGAKVDTTEVATLTAAQTLTNKTVTSGIFPGVSDFGGLVLWETGADVASGTSITLGTGGNTFQITGTATITTITAKATGTIVVLRFTGTAKLATGGNLVLTNAGFMGQNPSHIVLLSDGTNWHELSRSGDILAQGRFLITGTAPNILTATQTDILWDNEDSDMPDLSGMYPGSGGVFTPLKAGIYELRGHVEIVNTDKNGSRRLFLRKNGSQIARIHQSQSPTSTSDNIIMPFVTTVRVNGSTDTCSIAIRQDSGSTLALISGGAGCACVVRWLAP